jgi:nitroimidazol reductase NimA-like FMN-containing flavoprotein (pyridoxamine 5'-phosphate oxidase superfamily)
MPTIPIAKSSQWQAQEIRAFLIDTTVPIRLACQDANGFPLVCSLWFCFFENYLWCVSHEKSHIVKLLQANNKVAFEIGVNAPPYRGVRGQGEVTLLREP